MTASPPPPRLRRQAAVAPWKNTGNLKLVLEKARYGNLQGLQANIDASYSPDGLDVPIIFSRRATWISMRSPGRRVTRWR